MDIDAIFRDGLQSDFGHAELMKLDRALEDHQRQITTDLTNSKSRRRLALLQGDEAERLAAEGNIADQMLAAERAATRRNELVSLVQARARFEHDPMRRR